jgi:ubiquinone/menaquinone biosynthesis C-methylase UbiE
VSESPVQPGLVATIDAADAAPGDSARAASTRAAGAEARSPIDLETYYTEAGMDYRAWSRGFNMHFGFWRRWMNPFALERMLEQMSREVFARLAPADGDRVLDLGCGVGAPARALVAERRVELTAVTKVEWQIAMAQRLAEGTTPAGSVEWLLGDYTALELPAAAFQGAFSIEASCHAAGAAKEPFVREAARLLAPGARLVIADGFMKKPSDSIPRWYRSLLGFMTRSWAVERFADLDAFTACLERHGLAVEAVEDVSYRIAPSALHVPRVTIAFLFRELLVRRRWLNRTRWGHVLACIVAPFIGLGRSWFGYYLVTARKRS